MFCPNCGNQIPDGSAFCTVCGAKQEAKRGYQRGQQAFGGRAAKTAAKKAGGGFGKKLVSLALAGVVIYGGVSLLGDEPDDPKPVTPQPGQIETNDPNGGGTGGEIAAPKDGMDMFVNFLTIDLAEDVRDGEDYYVSHVKVKNGLLTADIPPLHLDWDNGNTKRTGDYPLSVTVNGVITEIQDLYTAPWGEKTRYSGVIYTPVAYEYTFQEYDLGKMVSSTNATMRSNPNEQALFMLTIYKDGHHQLSIRLPMLCNKDELWYGQEKTYNDEPMDLDFSLSSDGEAR